MIDKQELLNAALKYLEDGFNVIAIDENKKAVWSWTKYETQVITKEEITNQINYHKTAGIAIVCGVTSGNLEVIDLDADQDLTGTLIQKYYEAIPGALRDLFRIHKTRSGGRHLMYRAEVIDGNKKLASRPATKEEKEDNPHVKTLCLIETRGQGGYIAAPPMAGYEVVQDRPVPVIDLDNREITLDAARSFNEVYQEERPAATTGPNEFVLSPYEEYNLKGDVVGLLMQHGWTLDKERGDRVYLKRPGKTETQNSGNYRKDNRLFYVWSTSTEFESGKAYTPAHVYAILEHAGDHSAAGRALIRLGYGRKATPAAVREAIEKPADIPGKFWTVELNSNGKAGAIKINLVNLMRYLHTYGGFTGYKYNEKSGKQLVRVGDGLVKEVGVYEIRQFLKTAINTFGETFDAITPAELLERVLREYHKYLSDSFLDYLDHKELTFLQDTPTAAYFPFINGIVEVTKEGAKLHKYSEFKKYIWADEMVQREITLDPDPDFTKIDFCDFVRKVAGEDDARFDYFAQSIGYLLHKYKNPRRPWAIICAEETENEGEGGGTGKGIFIKGIKEMLGAETFDGKNFDTQKGFSFQRITLATKLIALEDVTKRFNFESLYSMITEGLTVEKKNQMETYIDYADSPKFIISTNYGINEEGNHAKRRRKVLEFSNYFNPERSPFDEYGKMFFDEWSAEDWNGFYNFMFTCVQAYLQNPAGISDFEQTDTNKAKNIRLKYGEEFLMWFRDYAGSSQPERSLGDIHQKFLNGTGIREADYKVERFGKALKFACDSFGLTYLKNTKRIDGKPQVVVQITPQ